MQMGTDVHTTVYRLGDIILVYLVLSKCEEYGF